MSTDRENNTGLTIAMIGGGALLGWLLWRGRGKGKGDGNDADHGSAPSAVQVQILGGDRLKLDGASADLATTVARARAAGAARVSVTGDASQGWFERVVHALRAAGVHVGLPPAARAS
jgi:hypothetical protein